MLSHNYIENDKEVMLEITAKARLDYPSYYVKDFQRTLIDGLCNEKKNIKQIEDPLPDGEKWLIPLNEADNTERNADELHSIGKPFPELIFYQFVTNCTTTSLCNFFEEIFIERELPFGQMSKMNIFGTAYTLVTAIYLDDMKTISSTLSEMQLDPTNSITCFQEVLYNEELISFNVFCHVYSIYCLQHDMVFDVKCLQQLIYEIVNCSSLNWVGNFICQHLIPMPCHATYSGGVYDKVMWLILCHHFKEAVDLLCSNTEIVGIYRICMLVKICNYTVDYEISYINKCILSLTDQLKQAPPKHVNWAISHSHSYIQPALILLVMHNIVTSNELKSIYSMHLLAKRVISECKPISAADCHQEILAINQIISQYRAKIITYMLLATIEAKYSKESKYVQLSEFYKSNGQIPLYLSAIDSQLKEEVITSLFVAKPVVCKYRRVISAINKSIAQSKAKIKDFLHHDTSCILNRSNSKWKAMVDFQTPRKKKQIMVTRSQATREVYHAVFNKLSVKNDKIHFIKHQNSFRISLNEKTSVSKGLPSAISMNNKTLSKNISLEIISTFLSTQRTKSIKFGYYSLLLFTTETKFEKRHSKSSSVAYSTHHKHVSYYVTPEISNNSTVNHSRSNSQAATPKSKVSYKLITINKISNSLSRQSSRQQFDSGAQQHRQEFD